MLQRCLDNAAARLGPARFDWWPRWQGRRIAIVACGPSLRGADLSMLRGRLPVIAIKEAAVHLCPWADMVYGCDLHWWVHRRGLPEFKGLKLGWAGGGGSGRFPDVKPIRIREARRKGQDKRYVDDILTDEPGEIGAGGNSAFQALNLAVQFGCSGVLAIGFDMRIAGGLHFYGRNDWPKANNPQEKFLEDCTRVFEATARRVADHGVEVLNASRVSAIKAFRKMTIERALMEWHL